MIVACKFLLLYHTGFTAIATPLWGSDGGLYGFYAKEILKGVSLAFDSEHLPAWLLVWIVKTFSISLDEAIYFSPPFLSALSVIPMMMIGFVYRIVPLTFLASIIGSLTYAYYIRSFLGYYDTDVLNLFFSMMIIAYMIISVEKKSILAFVFAMVFAVLFLFWYHSAKIIIVALFANYFFYLFIWKYFFLIKKYKILLFVVLSVVVTLFYIYEESLFAFLTRAFDYIFKAQNITFLQQNKHTLTFANTLATISEAKALPFEKLGKYLSINNIYFYISLLGLVLFYVRYTSFFLTFPLLILTFLSLKSGVRFSEYGVYIIAFGAVYPLYIFRNILIKIGLNSKIALFLWITLVLVLLTVYIQKIVDKNRALHPVFNSKSVALLKEVDKKLHQGDYILTWWDYGWPLWYYTKAYTLIDNAKHFEDNYLISKLLFSPQAYSAKAARYFLQNCSQRRCYVSKEIFKTKTPKEIDILIQHSNNKGENKNIYFFFHSRMIKIMKTILYFSLTDPQTGEKSRDKLLTVSKIQSIKKGMIFIYSKKLRLDIKKKFFIFKNKRYLLKDISFIGSKNFTMKSRYKKAYLHAIIYRHRYLIICNDTVFNSFFIQAFLLNNYDKRYFELIEQSQDIKILKLK